MKIFLSAGEVSGDIHGAYLAEALKKTIPDLEIEGIGGEAMRRAGVRTVSDLTSKNTVGFIEGIRHLPYHVRVLHETARYIRASQPDCVVFIDNQGFNVELAKKIRRAGIIAFYYFAPQLWLWGSKNAKKIEKNIDYILATFQKEFEFYHNNTTLTVDYIGHPLLDEIAVEHDHEILRQNFNVGTDGRRVIGLLPGSRTQELAVLLPEFLNVAASLKDTYDFILPFATERIARLYSHRIPPYIRVVTGQSHEVMACADLLIMASGTATLEAALFTTPMIITYKISKITEWIARKIVKISHIGMPNILLGREVCPELIQDDMNADTIILTVKNIMEDKGRYDIMRTELAEVRALLEPSGSVTRAAQLIKERCSNGQT